MESEFLLVVVTPVSSEPNSMDIAMEGATFNVRSFLQDFQDVFPEKLPTSLPPQRSVVHRIEMTPGAQPPRNTTNKMLPAELDELRKQLDELLAAGHIEPSKSPFGAPLLFVGKKDGTIRMCVDYRA